MARAPRLAALRRVVRTHRRAGWQLAAALALLGLLLGAQRLGWHRLTRAAGRAGPALAHATRLALSAGWLLLLLAAAALALSLILSGPAGRTAAGWVRWLVSPKGRWIVRFLVAVSLLAGLVLAVAVLPPRFTAHRHFKDATDELNAQNNVRATLLQALAGAVLATGAYLTFRQLQHNIQSSREQHDLDRQGQITDRYTKAVDQLGSEHLDVRVGGIYALERIARDSRDDRATIEEVLTTYVRDHAPWPPPPAPPSLQAITQRVVTFAHRQRAALQQLRAKNPAEQDQQGRLDQKRANPQGPPADVQAAMTVLGRRRLPPGGLRPLDLTGADLRGADLRGANLQAADLLTADLRGAILYGANLQAENLDALLQDAWADEDTRWPAGRDQAWAKDRGVLYSQVRFQKRSD